MKREKLNDRQKYEKDIRENAVSFTATLFVPGEGFRTREETTLGMVQVAARELWEESNKVRPVLVSAVRADGRFATMGQWDAKGWREFPI
jgi:hypothetical protein